MRCRPCGHVLTEEVAWSRHGSDFTRPFEDALALIARKVDKTAVARPFGISRGTVGKIADRVVGDLSDPERLRGLRRIGVDEIRFPRPDHRDQPRHREEPALTFA